MAPQEPHQETINKLVEILADQAMVDPLFYRKLIDQATLRKAWKRLRLGLLKEDPEYNARELIKWAFIQEGNPADFRYHTLGSLLEHILPLVGLEDQRFLTAFILAYDLYRDPGLQAGLRKTYRVPESADLVGIVGADAAAAAAFQEEISGAAFIWKPPEDDLELQAFSRGEPDMLDIGFLQRAMERASGVCRVEFEHIKRVGTGFLIAPDLVLTNYHNLNYRGDEDVDKNAANACYFCHLIHLFIELEWRL